MVVAAAAAVVVAGGGFVGRIMNTVASGCDSGCYSWIVGIGAGA